MAGQKDDVKRIPFLILAAVSAGLFIRSFYSFSWSDESFYLTIVHRFWLGERMMVDEWYTSQLSALLQLPFYALYQWLAGGSEGVYLYFRLLYWGMSTFVSIWTYHTLKKRNTAFASLACALVYLLYSRANIGGMSYYNMTLTCVLAAVLFLCDALCGEKAGGYRFFMAGIMLAFAVVNTPYLAFVYFVIVGYLLIRKKFRSFRREIFFMITGTTITAVIYMGYLLSKISMSEILFYIPWVLSEPELQHTNPVLAIPLIFVRIAWRFRWTIWAEAFLAVYIWYKRKTGTVWSRKQICAVILVDLLIFIVNSYLSVNLIGCINIAGILFLAPLWYGFAKSGTIHRGMAELFIVAGIGLSIGFTFSSDTGLDALAIGFVLLGMGGILLAFQITEQQKIQLLQGAVMIAVCVMIFQTALLRFFSVYRDAPVWELDTQITEGPAKYLYTTQKHVKEYEELKTAMEKYVREDDVIFYSPQCFWGYLCSDNAYGFPSSWRMPMNSERLALYYELNPGKIPTCVFVLNPAYGGYESSFIQNNEKVELPNVNRMEGYLYKYMMENHYEVIEEECATIYRRRNF